MFFDQTFKSSDAGIGFRFGVVHEVLVDFVAVIAVGVVDEGDDVVGRGGFGIVAGEVASSSGEVEEVVGVNLEHVDVGVGFEAHDFVGGGASRSGRGFEVV